MRKRRKLFCFKLSTEQISLTFRRVVEDSEAKRRKIHREILFLWLSNDGRNGEQQEVGGRKSQSNEESLNCNELISNAIISSFFFAFQRRICGEILISFFRIPSERKSFSFSSNCVDIEDLIGGESETKERNNIQKPKRSEINSSRFILYKFS